MSFEILPRDYNRDDGVSVRFFTDEVEDPALSREAGYKRHKSVLMAEIRQLGDNKSNWKGRVDDKIFFVRRGLEEPVMMDVRERYPWHWEQYQKSGGATEEVVGVPLDMLPDISKARARDFEQFGIRTVEEMASVPDGRIGKLGIGARDIVEKARRFLEVAAEAGVADREAERASQLEKRIAELEMRLQEAEGERDQDWAKAQTAKDALEDMAPKPEPEPKAVWPEWMQSLVDSDDRKALIAAYIDLVPDGEKSVDRRWSAKTIAERLIAGTAVGAAA